ncbi:hypothetical protein MFLAVUS_000562 [Mucor flavus]|uniref:Alpha-1,4-N-acetylglucosaminyltransferase n=1 Tax=Mucor flavus TaxID=439312 RepID=A0ABP9YK45_9FUNG
MLTWATTETTLIRPNLRQVAFIVLKWVSLITVLGLILFFTLFGIDLNLHVTLREPFSPMKHDPESLLSNCFKDYIPESSLSQHFGIIPSIPVIDDNLCYDFVSLIKPTKNLTAIFHTFWTGKTRSFSDIELATLRSFIATQSLESVIYVWTTSNDQDSLKPWIHDDRIQMQVIDNHELIQNTPLTDSSWLINHQLLKFAALYKFGGVWFDLNTLFIRNMSPLLSQEWVSQSNCLETYPKGFFLHFFKNSPYLCEIMTEANNQLISRQSLALDLYKTVFHRLLKLGIKTWSVLPWCYTDPSQCLKSNSLPSAFDRSEFDINKLNRVFAYHLHRSWNSSPGTIFKYLVNQHKKIVSW